MKVEFYSRIGSEYMNIVFYILIILAALILYIVCSSLFYKIGHIIEKIYKKFIDNINKE